MAWTVVGLITGTAHVISATRLTLLTEGSQHSPSLCGQPLRFRGGAVIESQLDVILGGSVSLRWPLHVLRQLRQGVGENVH